VGRAGHGRGEHDGHGGAGGAAGKVVKEATPLPLPHAFDKACGAVLGFC
jgi:hypothetical protein